MKKHLDIPSKSSLRRAFDYESRKQRQLFTIVMSIIAIVAFVWACCEPTAAYGVGVSMATMTLIGNIDDVSDRDTHGSEIAYQVVLIECSQIANPFSFPQPAASTRVVTLGKSILKEGESAHLFQAHAIPTLLSTAEKGDITTTGNNIFTVVMGGDRVSLKNFIEEYSGGKFIIFYKHIKDSVWHIIGEPERPMILGNTEHKDDADGRYTTLTFTRNSVYLDNLVTFDSNQSIEDLLNPGDS